LQVRALGSAFAHLGDSHSASLIALRGGPPAMPREVVDWRGDENDYIGWPGWLQLPAGGNATVADLAGARRAWVPTDEKSRQQKDAWPETLGADRLGPADLLSIYPAGAPILTRVAWPSPHLRPKTVEAFARLAIPELEPAAGTPNVSSPAVPPMPNPMAPGSFGAAPPAIARPDASASTPAPEVFEVTAAPWVGDIGRFVADRLAAGPKALRIVARGAGTFEMTPIRVPAGTSLSISVEPPAEGAPPLLWRPKPDVEAEALIDARGADLVLSGVRLTRDGSSKVKHLIRLEDGQLVLSGCRLTAPGTLDTGGAMVAFRAASSRPLPTRPGAPFPTTDRRPAAWSIA
jgi:hypothetical protein